MLPVNQHVLKDSAKNSCCESCWSITSSIRSLQRKEKSHPCNAGAVVLVILAAIDAAFSGDWSRIGVLSKEAELGLRPLLGLLGLFHVVCGSVTFLDASQKGYNPFPQTLKAKPRLTHA